MFSVRPFRQEHLWPLLDQEMNVSMRSFYETGIAETFENLKTNFTLFQDETVLVSGGILDIWPGRGQIWCVFNEETKANFVPVFRAIQRFLKSQLKFYNRIEVCIPYGFEQGKRRAELLGFRVEIELAPKFLPDGEDCTVLVMVGG